jgi:circadian clock protein KaiB
MPDDESPLKSLERAASERDSARFRLSLFVTGTTPNSRRAVANIRKLCEEYLQGRYELEVVDICDRPEMANNEQIIAAPTLIRHLPLPLRRFIGDMSHTERLMVGLEINNAAHQPLTP